MGAIVLFDGVCNFCSGSVNFIIERDGRDYFKFAPLQSDFARELLTKYRINPAQTDSVVVIENERSYIRSDAALRIAKNLGGWWSWLYGLRLVPRVIRDFFYQLFAKYRYRLFGKRDACIMPTAEIRQKFLA